MRKGLVALLVLFGLLVAVDRAALVLAEHEAAGRIRTSAGLDSTPSVAVRGFPFLTQVLRGRYDRVDVQMQGLRRSTRRAAATVTAYDVRVPLSQALAGHVVAVPVGRVQARIRLPYADLGRGRGVRVGREGGRLRLSGTLSFLGLQVPVTGLADVRVAGTSVRVTPTRVSVGGASSGVLDAAARRLLHLDVGVGRLPYGLRLTGVQAAADGLEVTASAGPALLGTTALGAPRPAP